MEGNHLDPAAFHGFVSGTLTPDEREVALAHLDECSRCRKLLSALASDDDGSDGSETLDGIQEPDTDKERLRQTAQERTVDLRKAQAGTELVPPLVTPKKKRLDLDDTTSPDAAQLAPTKESISVRRQMPLQVEQLPIPSDKLVGQKLGDYLVQELLAKGGMGAVYKGIQPLIGKQVAIKVLLTAGPAELNYAQRMLEEARTVNAIGHPNIIDIFNFGELPDGRPWLVMEYLDGMSLSQWVRARTSDEPPTARIISILEQICAALEAVHAVGVVHRDLKPANVMLTHMAAPEPRVKVLDFGFAKSGESTLRTSPDMVLGTPGYMAPEQIQAIGTTPQSDLYSLGLMAYFMITGMDAFYDKSPIAVLQMQLQREPTSLKGRPGVPDGLAQLIADLTRINPQLRPVSARAVRERLQAIVSGAPAPATANSEVITLKESHPPAPASRPSTVKPGRLAQKTFDPEKTEPERQSEGQKKVDRLEAAIDGAMLDLSKSQMRSVSSSKWPWVVAVVSAIALGLGTWILLR